MLPDGADHKVSQHSWPVVCCDTSCVPMTSTLRGKGASILRHLFLKKIDSDENRKMEQLALPCP